MTAKSTVVTDSTVTVATSPTVGTIMDPVTPDACPAPQNQVQNAEEWVDALWWTCST